MCVALDSPFLDGYKSSGSGNAKNRRKGGSPVKYKSVAVIVVLFVVGACLGPLLSGQVPKDLDYKAPDKTWVLVVNLASVRDAQWKITLAKEDGDSKSHTFQAKARTLQQQLDCTGWVMLSGSGYVPNWQQCEERKRAIHREMDTLKADYAGSLEKWIKQQRNESSYTIKKIAECYGAHLVLEHVSDADFSTDCHRKLSLIACGQATPLYVHKSVDITHAVIETMERWANIKSSSPRSK